MTFLYLRTQSEPLEDGQIRGYRTFDEKSADARHLINEAIYILDKLGIPILDKTGRQLERMALAFLALCNVQTRGIWQKSQSLDDNYSLKTREIIDFINRQFGENISRGSYDDIRRKDLKHLILAQIVVSSHPDSARNDPKRGWAINSEYINVIRAYGSAHWDDALATVHHKTTLRERLSSSHNIPKIPITLPSGTTLQFGIGEHNQLQKAIIEEFLPRYGYDAQVIYVGDAEDKFLHYDRETATQLGLTQLAHEELPDVIAYSTKKEWLYLIEAVHSSGAMTQERILALESLIENCSVPVIYMTAFLNRQTFRKFVADIAWETEVWIASDPDHVIHFNGDKFLGPYNINE